MCYLLVKCDAPDKTKQAKPEFEIRGKILSLLYELPLGPEWLWESVPTSTR